MDVGENFELLNKGLDTSRGCVELPLSNHHNVRRRNDPQTCDMEDPYKCAIEMSDIKAFAYAKTCQLHNESNSRYFVLRDILIH